MKNFLFVLSKPPHSGAYAQETLDILMTVAAFDQAVSILLLDSGVFQLKTQQHPEGLGLKDVSAIFKALPLYNISAIYAETESLRNMGLTSQDLVEPVIEIPRNQVGEFFNTFDLVINS